MIFRNKTVDVSGTNVLTAFILASMLVVLLGNPGLSFGQHGPKVFSESNSPGDVRLQPPKDLNGYFPFDPPATRGQWDERAEQLRHQVQVALGLYPFPEKTPLNPIIHGKVVMDDYTVEKVFFESLPGYFVTGSLYRPKEMAKGGHPGVLCPHGHWANGRFYDAGEANAKSQIAQKAESKIAAARNPIQARCVHLARMGCVVLQYDMIGYADSVQISYELAHRFAKQRPEYSTESNWGLFSPQAERHLQSIMGLQTWNSIRALDFLETLPEVDPKRLAVTGASGGGTQTFLLAAMDPRPQVSFPAVMVSTAMQGGCTCENCSLLRVTTGNVELAALFAPKPQGVTAANDWTKEMRSKGYPELKELYRLMGAEDKVMLVDRTEFGHNYNKVSRTAMYRWFQKHLNLEGSIEERPYRRLTGEELSVWSGDYSKPEFDPDFERRLLRQWHKMTKRKLLDGAPQNVRQRLKKAYTAIFQRQAPDAGDVVFETTSKSEEDARWIISGVVKNTEKKEAIPAVFIHPKDWNGEVVLVLGETGKKCLFQANGKLVPPVAKMVSEGTSVVSADLLFQGEFLTADKPLDTTRKVANPREAAAYTFGYNHTLFAQRTHDVVNLLTLLANHEREPTSIEIHAIGKTGSIAAAARLLSDSVDRLTISADCLEALDVERIHDPYFLPGSGRYFGVWGMISAADQPVSIAGSSSIPQPEVELPLPKLRLADSLFKN